MVAVARFSSRAVGRAASGPRSLVRARRLLRLFPEIERVVNGEGDGGKGESGAARAEQFEAQLRLFCLMWTTCWTFRCARKISSRTVPQHCYEQTKATVAQFETRRCYVVYFWLLVAVAVAVATAMPMLTHDGAHMVSFCGILHACKHRKPGALIYLRHRFSANLASLFGDLVLP